jgi:hypothetical protein
MTGGNIGRWTVRETKPEASPKLCEAEKAVFGIIGKTEAEGEKPARRSPCYATGGANGPWNGGFLEYGGRKAYMILQIQEGDRRMKGRVGSSGGLAENQTGRPPKTHFQWNFFWFFFGSK